MVFVLLPVVPALESRHIRSDALSIRSPVVHDERMKPGGWLELVLSVFSNALAVIVRWQKGHMAHEDTVPLVPRGYLPEHMVEENPRASHVAQAH